LIYFSTSLPGKQGWIEYSPSFNHARQVFHAMSQMSFSDFESAGKRKQTLHKRVLIEKDHVVPRALFKGS